MYSLGYTISNIIHSNSNRENRVFVCANGCRYNLEFLVW